MQAREWAERWLRAQRSRNSIRSCQRRRARSLLPQELELVRARRSAQDRVAMRKATKAPDDTAVVRGAFGSGAPGCTKLRRSFVHEVLRKTHCALVQLERLEVNERHDAKQALFEWQCEVAWSRGHDLRRTRSLRGGLGRRHGRQRPPVDLDPQLRFLIDERRWRHWASLSCGARLPGSRAGLLGRSPRSTDRPHARH